MIADCHGHPILIVVAISNRLKSACLCAIETQQASLRHRRGTPEHIRTGLAAPLKLSHYPHLILPERRPTKSRLTRYRRATGAMIRSMTGFARRERQGEWGTLTANCVRSITAISKCRCACRTSSDADATFVSRSTGALRRGKVDAIFT